MVNHLDIVWFSPSPIELRFAVWHCVAIVSELRGQKFLFKHVDIHLLNAIIRAGTAVSTVLPLDITTAVAVDCED